MFVLKCEITGKHPEEHEKQYPTENQNSTKYQNMS